MVKSKNSSTKNRKNVRMRTSQPTTDKILKIKDKTKPLNYKTTAEIQVPKNISGQIIGQEEGLKIIKKASKQRRNVLLIGYPGTGKSLLGQALAEEVQTTKLADVLCFPNEQDENNPLVRIMPKGKGRELINRLKIQSMASSRNINIILFIVLIISLITPWWIRKEYGDILAAASLIGSMIFFVGFLLFINLNKRFSVQKIKVPKLLVDNSEQKTAPFIDACLLPGQKVFTNPHPIEIEKTTNKLVYNAKGKKQKVIRVERIPWEGKIYSIKPRLLFPFTATQNHPFLVLEKPKTKQFKVREFETSKFNKNIYNYIRWKKAEELTNNDYLIYPKMSHAKKYKIIQIDDKTKKIPKEIVLDEEVAEIFGWYIAEGYAREKKCTIGFTLGYKETKEIKRIKYLIKKKFNLESSIDTHSKRSIELLIYSKAITRLFMTLFGVGAKNKKIPKIIFESPKNAKIKFLKSYINGDGYQKKNLIYLATTSKNIAEDIIFLFSSLGIFPTCSYRRMKDSKIKGRKIQGPNIYEFNITGKQIRKLDGKGGKFQHYFSKGDYNFIKIRNIEVKDYKGDIINMETEDGTYLMPCITHNTGMKAGALLGDCLHDPLQSGGLGTPAHERISPGAVHKANGGVLFIDEVGLLDYHSQQELLTSLQEKKYRITGQSERSSGSMVSTEPVPTDFILVAAGNLETIEKMHPALRSRIRGYGYEVYMNETMDDNTENKNKLVQFVAQEIVKDKKIPHFAKEAVEEIIKEARKMAGTSGKLTVRLRELGGLVRAAGDLAIEQGAKLVEKEHVLKAMQFARPLEQQLADKYIENKKKYEVIITQGTRVGRVNGLAVIGSGAALSGLVLPIESEVTPGGEKAEFIATGQLGKIAKEAVKNVSAIILKSFGEDIKEKHDIYVQFLYTAGSGVEGDSASIAVATAIVSALKKIPVKQEIAMTGSLSIRGEVLPIGGATAKVEAAIEAGCKQAIIPKRNYDDLVLSKEQLQKIKIIPVENFVQVLKNALVWKAKDRKILKKLERSK